MNLKSQQSRSQVIVYDADCITQPTSRLFEPDYWRQDQAIVEMMPGRGNTLLLETTFGPAVLRTCLRGGWMARFSRDRYLFTGFRNARPLAELRLLARLTAMRLPVPLPLAALCTRSGLTYTGALLTRQIRAAKTLADMLQVPLAGKAEWFRIGQCIRRFHDAGVIHPDLNARNILLVCPGSGQVEVFLVDFDRAYMRSGADRKFRGNLRRLRRSLTKLWPAAGVRELEPCWSELMAGYNSAS
jgi:3-deoxy-D-manno-octulosonic acid kinase